MGHAHFLLLISVETSKILLFELFVSQKSNVGNWILLIVIFGISPWSQPNPPRFDKRRNELSAKAKAYDKILDKKQQQIT